MLIAALMSAWSAKPHCTQANWSWVFRFASRYAHSASTRGWCCVDRPRPGEHLPAQPYRSPEALGYIHPPSEDQRRIQPIRPLHYSSSIRTAILPAMHLLRLAALIAFPVLAVLPALAQDASPWQLQDAG